MEVRKIQMTGGSSYIITLPKSWVESLKLKKNDSVGVIVQQDGSLVVTPRPDEEPEKKEAKFQISRDSPPERVFRLLAAAYIAGCSTITISSKEPLHPGIRKAVRAFSSMSISQEIVEEQDNLIQIKDLLNPLEMSFDKTIRRMRAIVRQMCSDSVGLLSGESETQAQDIIERDSLVDRLCWLVARQHSLLLKNPSLAKRLETNTEQATAYLLASRHIERIGDHAARIAGNSKEISGKLGEEVMSEITASGKLAIGIFEESIEALLSADAERANSAIEKVERLEKMCNGLEKLALRSKPKMMLSLGSITESIRRIGEYSRDISEKAIDLSFSSGK